MNGTDISFNLQDNHVVWGVSPPSDCFPAERSTSTYSYASIVYVSRTQHTVFNLSDCGVNLTCSHGDRQFFFLIFWYKLSLTKWTKCSVSIKATWEMQVTFILFEIHCPLLTFILIDICAKLLNYAQKPVLWGHVDRRPPNSNSPSKCLLSEMQEQCISHPKTKRT